MQRYLTTSQKDKFKSYLLRKQNNKCLFCFDPLTPTPANNDMATTYEHLDNNVFHNDLENLALAHKRCNNDKKHNSDYQIIARDQMKSNSLAVDSLSVSDQARHEPKHTPKVVDINVAMYNITKEYLHERLVVQGKPALDFNDAAYSIFYIMKEATGHGSSETSKRHILGLCSTAAPYDKQEDQNGRWIIIKRTKAINEHA